MNAFPCLVVCGLLWAAGAAAEVPDAERILRGARMSAALVKTEKGLEGRLRQGFRSVPLHLFLMGGDIQFQITDGNAPAQVFHMRLGEERCEWFEIVGGKRQTLDAGRMLSPIAGTDLTYEDLSLSFLYWPKPRHEGMQAVAGQPCHKIRIERPKDSPGNYEVIYVWVHEKFGAFMRIRAHDARGGLVKEFQVEDVMQIDNETWTLRKMQVSTHDPADGRRKSLTDVSFDTPNRRGPRGLR